MKVQRWFLSGVLTILFGSSAFAAPEPTEIQMFLNYRGPSQYSLKIVSTVENPVSAFYIMVQPKQTPTTAACYRGKPYDAFRLMETMVAMFNAEYRRNIHITGEVYYQPGNPEAYLRLFEIDEDGSRWTWFDALNTCTRPSTPGQRWPTP